MKLNKPLNALLAAVMGAGLLLTGTANAQKYPADANRPNSEMEILALQHFGD